MVGARGWSQQLPNRERHKSILWPAVCCGVKPTADRELREKIPSHDVCVDLEESAAVWLFALQEGRHEVLYTL